MQLGCLTFSHPHQQKTAEVQVFKSCTQICVTFERSGFFLRLIDYFGTLPIPPVI